MTWYAAGKDTRSGETEWISIRDPDQPPTKRQIRDMTGWTDIYITDSSDTLWKYLSRRGI